MPYLICDKCNKYYKLQKGESAADFAYCPCGNRLKYYEYIHDYTKLLESTNSIRKNKITEYWAEQSTLIKLTSILAILLVGSLIIVEISNVSSYSGPQSDTQNVANGGNRLTIIVFYATWCSSSREYDKTLSDNRVKEKIKNYNFQKLDVDQNRQTALKYSKDGTMVLPTTIILDNNGNVKAKYEGYMASDELLRVL
ncbi:MAG: thioredoxin family protein [Methanobacterium sp.]|nr:thioredoxin family protein [Methanobacterium sp.]